MPRSTVPRSPVELSFSTILLYTSLLFSHAAASPTRTVPSTYFYLPQVASATATPISIPLGEPTSTLTTVAPRKHWWWWNEYRPALPLDLDPVDVGDREYTTVPPAHVASLGSGGVRVSSVLHSQEGWTPFTPHIIRTAAAADAAATSVQSSTRHSTTGLDLRPPPSHGHGVPPSATPTKRQRFRTLRSLYGEWPPQRLTDLTYTPFINHHVDYPGHTFTVNGTLSVATCAYGAPAPTSTYASRYSTGRFRLGNNERESRESSAETKKTKTLGTLPYPLPTTPAMAADTVTPSPKPTHLHLHLSTSAASHQVNPETQTRLVDTNRQSTFPHPFILLPRPRPLPLPRPLPRPLHPPAASTWSAYCYSTLLASYPAAAIFSLENGVLEDYHDGVRWEWEVAVAGGGGAGGACLGKGKGKAPPLPPRDGDVDVDMECGGGGHGDDDDVDGEERLGEAEAGMWSVYGGTWMEVEVNEEELAMGFWVGGDESEMHGAEAERGMMMGMDRPVMLDSTICRVGGGEGEGEGAGEGGHVYMGLEVVAVRDC